MTWINEAIDLAENGVSWRKIAKQLNKSKSTVSDALRKHFKGYTRPSDVMGKGVVRDATKNSPRILVLDIETRQMLLGGFGLFNQNFSIEQIEEDWSIISFSAKWVGEDEVIYMDVSENTEDELLSVLHNLLNEADFTITHNGRRFDHKKIRARMIARGFKPHSPVRIIDTFEVVKKEFGFTSNKLAYLTQLLCKKNVKSGHEKFPGYMLWREFLRGNPEAISEMREYNIIDVLSLEELYFILAPWSTTLPVFEVYDDEVSDMSDWVEDGFHYSNLGKYRRYRNIKTGQYRRGRVNELSKEKRKSLLANII